MLKSTVFCTASAAVAEVAERIKPVDERHHDVARGREHEEDGLPSGQTPRTTPAISSINTTSPANTAPSGRILPSTISAEVAGVTCSWSKVPPSRSFTTETAVMRW